MTSTNSDGQLETVENQARAWFVGTRIDVREFERREPVALSPLTIRAGERGYAILFRYGVAVLIDLTPVEEATFLRAIAPYVTEPFAEPETEHVAIGLVVDDRERVDAEDVLRLREVSLDRLHVVAHILAKSAVLAHYEQRIAITFDQIERLALQLQHGSGQRKSGSDLLQQIGESLMAEIHTVGRVEITEKPESTWDHPDLDRLYERLSIEYELQDRDRALTRKLDFIAQTAQTYLDVLQTRQGLRIEWYIVGLILVEIALSLYEMFFA